MADPESTSEDGFDSWTSCSALKTVLHHPRADAANMSSNTDGEPVFRLAEMPSKPTLPRDEFNMFFDDLMTELFGPDPDGDEIVPQKLAKLFPGSGLLVADRRPSR
jgi:hypothetical protein